VIKSLKNLLDSQKQKLKDFPPFSKWKLLFKVLAPKEKLFFIFFFFCFIISLLSLFANFYFSKTRVIATQGGIYIEGIVGQPRFINPVLASSDVDRDLVEILFSGLMKEEIEGDFSPNLAEKYEIKQQGTVYEITLKENIFWHDEKEITASDVVFTIKTIQDPEFKSPEIANWVGVEVEEISDKKVMFKLKDPYFPFLERLTIKIIPKHVFGEIAPENFPLATYNLQEPIGSGPFEFKEIKYNNLGKVESLILSQNKNYFGEKPYLKEIKFLFFEDEKELLNALEKREILGLATSNPQVIELLKEKRVNSYEIKVPRYFAVFFNPKKSEILEEKNIRKALTISINKSEVLKRAAKNFGEIVNSPILPEFYGFDLPQDSDIFEFNLDLAKQILKEQGFVEKNGKFFEPEKNLEFIFEKDLKKGSKGKDVENLQKCLSFFEDIYPGGEITGYFGNATEQAVILFQEKYKQDILDPWNFEKGTGLVSETTREKLNQVCNKSQEEQPHLTLTLHTVNQPFLVETCKVLEEQWEKLGIEIKIESLEFNELIREVIKPREYEMLLFGQALGLIPDPLAFWHSSRIEDPGLNLAMYENEKADDFLKKARMSNDLEDLNENLVNFQNILIKDYPVIFLYSPSLFYSIPSNIKGVNFGMVADFSKRFTNIENWYINTKRVWK